MKAFSAKGVADRGRERRVKQSSVSADDLFRIRLGLWLKEKTVWFEAGYTKAASIFAAAPSDYSRGQLQHYKTALGVMRQLSSHVYRPDPPVD